MDFSTATYLIAGLALACGVIAYRWSADLGDKLPGWLRETARVNMALCVLLAAWGCISFALWAAGANLKIVAITNGQMHKAWWLGPAALAWALFSLNELKKATTPR